MDTQTSNQDVRLSLFFEFRSCELTPALQAVRPDIWFLPSEVWEIKGADFTLSPVYPAAQGLVSERGISVRFPRFIKLRGPADKSPENATTANELADMYRNQFHGDKVGGEEQEVEEEAEGLVE